ncbi:hypothetical protein B0H10DRAFT_13539 [Mycena sp. CBHHK59/15]|nr:hypothetical protein B0H10DRAFT_13539 [Mycena sp. CBHHK59/15]
MSCPAKWPLPFNTPFRTTPMRGNNMRYPRLMMARNVTGIFASSSAFLVVNASSTSSSVASSSTSASSTSLSPSTSSPSASQPAAASSSSSASATPKKSTPSVGLIVGVTFGVTAVLLVVVLLLFLYIRKLRRRKRMNFETRSIDPNYMAESDLAKGYSSTNASLAAQRIQPFFSDTSATTEPVSTLSSKAAQVRQEYLTNQMRAVQRQMAELQVVVGTGPLTTSDDSVRGDAGDSTGLEQARRQNELLQARIQALESQLQSQWALGLSDEPPPGYMEYV